MLLGAGLPAKGWVLGFGDKEVIKTEANCSSPRGFRAVEEASRENLA